MQDEQQACLGSPRHEVRLIGSSLKDKVYKPTTTINKKPSLRPQICAAISSTSYFLIVGMGFSYSGILIPQLEANSYDNVTSNNSLHVTKQDTAWIASSFILVMPLGALLAGMAMEYVGRLNTIKLAAIPCSIGWILIATAQNVPQIIIGRIITGIFSGFGMSPPVVYVTEIASPKLRSSLISFAPTFMSLAMLLLYWSNMYLNWRQTAWLAQIYIAVPFTLAFLFPESPVWLVSKGRTEDAEKALRRLNGQERAETQISTLVKSQEELNSTRNKLSLKSRLLLFTKPSGYKPVIILITLFVFQQFSGIYTTLFYAVTFLQDVRSAMDPGITTVLLGIVRFVMSFVISFLMRHYGRRPLLIFSCLTESASMVVSGYFSYTILAAPDHGAAGETSWGPPICLLVYVCTSMLGFLSIPWVITAEFFPTEIRSLGHGITNASAYLLMFLAVQTYRPLVEALGTHVMQWSFAGMALAAATFVYFFVPETRGKTLAEITHFFDEPIDKGNNNCTSNGKQTFVDSEAQEKLQPH